MEKLGGKYLMKATIDVVEDCKKNYKSGMYLKIYIYIL